MSVSLSHLNGPPRIGGIDCPYCLDGAPAVLEWDDSESTTRTLQGGLIETVTVRERARLTLSWMLPRDLYATLLAELSQRTVAVEPRTKLATDPAWAEELTLTMRRTSTLPGLADVRHGYAELRVELESVATFAERPDIVTGGYYAADIDGGYDLSGYGGATVEQTGTRTVTFEGVDYDLGVVALGTAAIADLRTEIITRSSGLRVLRITTKPTPLA